MALPWTKAQIRYLAQPKENMPSTKAGDDLRYAHMSAEDMVFGVMPPAMHKCPYCGTSQTLGDTDICVSCGGAVLTMRGDSNLPLRDAGEDAALGGFIFPELLPNVPIEEHGTLRQ